MGISICGGQFPIEDPPVELFGIQEIRVAEASEAKMPPEDLFADAGLGRSNPNSHPEGIHRNRLNAPRPGPLG